MSSIVKGRLSLIIPTYNEVQNIPVLIEELRTVLQGRDVEIWVMDDNSTDGTMDAVAESQKHWDRVHGVVRTHDRGLSRSVIDGFSRSHGEYLGVMDADGSHDPHALPSLLDAVQKGADFAVGCRWLPGGGVPGWPWYRRFVSSAAAGFAKVLLNTPLNDPMSGYFVCRREVFERAQPRLIGEGFKILLELWAVGKPARIVELPFVFRDRRRGETKVSSRVLLEYFKMVWRLRLSNKSVD